MKPPDQVPVETGCPMSERPGPLQRISQPCSGNFVVGFSSVVVITGRDGTPAVETILVLGSGFVPSFRECIRKSYKGNWGRRGGRREDGVVVGVLDGGSGPTVRVTSSGLRRRPPVTEPGPLS